MTRKTAAYGVVLGMAALAGCARELESPTPVAAPAVNEAPPVTAPPSAAPPAEPGSSSIAGHYSMTLGIGPQCAAIPAVDRSRRYTATIERNPNAPNGQVGYLATLAGSTFLSGLICTMGSGLYAGVGCDQFFVPTDGENVWLSLAISDDDGHEGHITEQTASGTWMQISGTAGGRPGPSGIVATGTANVWYCPTASSYPFPCPSYVSCEAALEVTLTRR